jgi:hypothetical protein
LSNPRLWDHQNAEGVYYLQPRVARASALPWVIKRKQIPTLKGLRIGSLRTINICEPQFNTGWWLPSATLSGLRFHVRSLPRVAALTRVNPGLEVVNAFGVHVRDEQLAITQGRPKFMATLRVEHGRVKERSDCSNE